MSDTGEPTIEKRFKIPEGSIGHERLTATQAVIREIQVEYPEVLSLCVFGSSTTGHAKDTSDIDGWLFVDVTCLSQRAGIAENELIETVVKKREWGGSSKSIRLKDDVGERYNYLVRDRLQQRLGLDDKQLEHIRSRPISESIVDELVGDLVTYDINMQAYRQACDETNRRLEAHDTGVDITSAKMPERPSLGVLPDMFHLAVGRGIEPWRTMLIDKLTQLGDSGERIWHELIVDTEMLENHLNAGTNKVYPRTLDQAQQVYGKSN